ncbi:acetyl esterase [Tistlia consotensis]|uniref:Acetyl esterase n=1 Tax=Tistlia consotensis USBA 355 TaxID=560819 RepID=A0A1Y6CWI9_9PROT|nr:alpha/beta hydrolase [Tistlia consotensis]SMF82583.1 acetyl esterase [Tistlia consotensis USBA 355]SNS29453.1 acetyl esterase [Tistlia consotensis]
MAFEEFDLAPGIREFLARSEAAYPLNATELSLAEQRACYDALCRSFAEDRPAGVSVEELSAPAGGRAVPLRLYRPAGVERPPVLLYCHGGGWVLGGLDSHDAVVAELVAGAGCAAVSVDYRLAPEHRWPAQIDDAWTALTWLADAAESLGLDGGRIAVAGDSAGGQLAAALALKARAAAAPRLVGQVLIYPALGLEFAEPQRAPAPDGPGLTHADMAAYHLQLFGATVPRDALAHPLLAGDLANLPPAVIVAAEYDPLRDDAAVYAERLAAAGVPVEHRCFAGLIHGCLRARHMSPAAGAMFAQLVAGTRRLFAAA